MNFLKKWKEKRVTKKIEADFDKTFNSFKVLYPPETIKKYFPFITFKSDEEEKNYFDNKYGDLFPIFRNVVDMYSKDYLNIMANVKTVSDAKNLIIDKSNHMINLFKFLVSSGIIKTIIVNEVLHIFSSMYEQSETDTIEDIEECINELIYISGKSLSISSNIADTFHTIDIKYPNSIRLSHNIEYEIGLFNEIPSDGITDIISKRRELETIAADVKVYIEHRTARNCTSKESHYDIKSLEISSILKYFISETRFNFNEECNFFKFNTGDGFNNEKRLELFRESKFGNRYDDFIEDYNILEIFEYQKNMYTIILKEADGYLKLDFIELLYDEKKNTYYGKSSIMDPSKELVGMTEERFMLYLKLYIVGMYHACAFTVF